LMDRTPGLKLPNTFGVFLQSQTDALLRPGRLFVTEPLSTIMSL